MFECPGTSPPASAEVKPPPTLRIPSMVIWFVYTLLVSGICGQIGHLALEPSESYIQVFRVIAAAACLAYAVGQFHNAIWKGERWSVTPPILNRHVSKTSLH